MYDLTSDIDIERVMSNRSFEDKQIFQDGISNYAYINKDGRLDLEEFCCTLSACFDFDGILEKSPRPRDIYDLLVGLIVENAEAGMAERWIQRQNVVGWTPAAGHIYPDKFRTYIHVAALASYWHTWISDIGYVLMNIPEPENNGKYYDWVNEDWFFTFLFIDGFQNKLTEFFQEFDRKGIEKTGYSVFEVLHSAVKNDVSFDEAKLQLEIRNEARTEALSRIRSAMCAGFFLESITLQECLISNCIYNYLNAKNDACKESNLFDLLKRMLRINTSATSQVKAMFRNIDEWRKNRNVAIHGFITSKTSDLVLSEDKFLHFSNETAANGLKLCEEISNWYNDEAVKFQPTRFGQKNDKLLH